MKYIIKIKDLHKAGDEKESSELITTGTLTFFGEDYKIRYKETSEGLEDCFVTLSYENGNCVTMTRTGGFTTQMTMEKHKRHTCVYTTPVGTLSLGIYTNNVVSSMTKDGGTLLFEYTLDANGGFLSDNTLEVTIEKAKEG
ncbi:MAG: DUF1934 domain-containing protein [Clostridia bacterium]|nr:DUF1934 domain-containing protein [Clostridia bacterium]